MASARHVRLPPFSETLPAPIFFRTACVPAESTYPRHRHAWGEFVYSFSGVMEVKLADHHYLAPPQYGIWLPPNVEHRGLNRYEACHCSLYIAADLSTALPANPCALTLSPLIRALLDHLRQHPPGLPRTEADERLLRVLVDQLAAAPRAGSYLPTSDDPLLGPVLDALSANPADNRTLPELAREANTTERTLMRRCQRDLGISFAEWRQRLRVVRAMALLEAGQTVESIALDLGYASASAFIAMFRRLMGVTPDEFRRGTA
ncbi:AraC family transcriptional regulator [Pseudomonas sp. PIC25]|uniref:AraC family transcriptional regulator n=1 Tax=Pseudomonas sp. PIC25 TaxID=1958773 RepID=UPI000BABA133|nr:helix-turn-helix transcriptional regulator [Pseudomonas sp. PIC25]PAU62794.1 AraC family transcriptional regulator [Pseudomonas sp. PIC25]